MEIPYLLCVRYPAKGSLSRFLALSETIQRLTGIHMSMRTMTTLALLMLGATLSLASDPTGTWKGKLNIKFPPPPASANAQQKAQMEQMKAQIQKAVLTLTLAKNKTFTMKASGFPAGGGNNEQKGKWSVKGDEVTFKGEKDAKNPNAPTPPDQIGKLSKDGKTLTITIPNGMGSIIFKK